MYRRIANMNMDIKDLQNAVVYYSFTSMDGSDYAYLYMIVNHKFYWIDENDEVAEPLSQDTIDSFIQSIENGEYDLRAPVRADSPRELCSGWDWRLGYFHNALAYLHVG